jgi:hypothetical protein
VKPGHGTSRAYTLDRLKREHGADAARASPVRLRRAGHHRQRRRGTRTTRVLIASARPRRNPAEAAAFRVRSRFRTLRGHRARVGSPTH